MNTVASRACRWPLALILTAVATLGACVDEPTAVTPPPTATKVTASVGDDIANVFMVTSRSGGTDVGSLRWAMSLSTGNDTVRFDPSLAGHMIVLEGTAVATKHVTIEGDAKYGVTVSGAGRYRVMFALEGMTLRNMTIADGYGVDGAGITSQGPLTLDHVTVYNNLATAGAGGVTATDATLINSTVAYNTAPYTAGIAYHSNGGKLTLVNSTVASNSPGKGIGPSGTTTTTPPVVTLRNSIVSKNGNGQWNFNCYNDYGFRYEGANVISDNSCGAGAGVVLADARLQTIANNGGPNVTMGLIRWSPAINAGVGCGVAVDQRYVARDAKCDVGAFEFTDFNVITYTINPNVTVDKNTRIAEVTGTVSCKYDDYDDDIGFRIELQQRSKLAASASGFRCRTTPKAWSALFQTTGGGFTNGSGVVTITTPWGVPTWYTQPEAVSRSVKLSTK